jgi:hypothetical protein
MKPNPKEAYREQRSQIYIKKIPKKIVRLLKQIFQKELNDSYLDLPSDNIFNFDEQLIPILPITDTLHIMSRKQIQKGSMLKQKDNISIGYINHSLSFHLFGYARTSKVQFHFSYMTIITHMDSIAIITSQRKLK